MESLRLSIQLAVTKANNGEAQIGFHAKLSFSRKFHFTPMKTLKSTFILLTSAFASPYIAQAQPAKITNTKLLGPSAKQWTIGQAITIEPSTPQEKIIACVGQSLDLGVTATDRDHWETRQPGNTLAQEGDENDTLKYAWSGGGTFTAPIAASTKWSSPITGTFTLTVTVNDTPTPVVAPETGARDDAAVTRNFEVCVIDPGPPSTSVSSVTFTDVTVPVPAPVPVSPDAWGETRPDGPTLNMVLGLDCDTKKWKPVITGATSTISTWTQPPPREADLNSVDRCNYKDVIRDLSFTVPLPGNITWYMSGAIESHEFGHNLDWRDIVDREFAISKAAIESVTVDATCDKDGAAAASEMMKSEAYKRTYRDFQANVSSAWVASGATAHAPGGSSYNLQRGLLDIRIGEIQRRAQEQHWAEINANPQTPACP